MNHTTRKARRKQIKASNSSILNIVSQMSNHGNISSIFDRIVFGITGAVKHHNPDVGARRAVPRLVEARLAPVYQ